MNKKTAIILCATWLAVSWFLAAIVNVPGWFATLLGAAAVGVYIGRAD